MIGEILTYRCGFLIFVDRKKMISQLNFSCIFQKKVYNKEI